MVVEEKNSSRRPRPRHGRGRGVTARRLRGILLEHNDTSFSFLVICLDGKGEKNGLRDRWSGASKRKRNHPETLTGMNNLASVLGGQGKYEQAEEMHRQALGLSETVLGKEHPSTLTSMNNLALVLSHQGKYEQAEEMHRQE